MNSSPSEFSLPSKPSQSTKRQPRHPPSFSPSLSSSLHLLRPTTTPSLDQRHRLLASLSHHPATMRQPLHSQTRPGLPSSLFNCPQAVAATLPTTEEDAIAEDALPFHIAELQALLFNKDNPIPSTPSPVYLVYVRNRVLNMLANFLSHSSPSLNQQYVYSSFRNHSE